MASIATENVKLGEEKRHQEAVAQQARLSGEQEEHRRRNADNVLKQFRVALVEGEIPGTEALTDACLKAEQLLLEQAQSPSIDPETRKLLEDIAQMAGSAKQAARHNDLGDRLNKIAEETKKALAASAKAAAHGAPAATIAASKSAIEMVTTWKPLFTQLATSKDFRILIVDSLKMGQKLFSRHTAGLGDKVEKKFVEGEKVTDIAKDVGEKAKDNAQDYSGEYQLQISDEEWNRVQDDWFRVVQQLHTQPVYNSGVQGMFKLLDLVHDQLSTSGTTVVAEVHAQRARVETEELIASIAGRDVFYGWEASLKKLIHKVDKDERSKEYLKEFREFLVNTKNAKIGKEEFKQKGRDLVNRGRQLIHEFKYSNELDDFFDRSNKLMEGIRHEETLTVLRHHAGIVVSDLSFVDKEGTVQVDLDMLSKLRDVVVPVMAEQMKYIPLPKIHSDDENREYWVDSIVLCGYDVIPENVRFQIHSDSNVNLRDAKTQHSETRLEITLSKIRTELKNCEFFYHRKSFPELTEQGRATVRIGGDGATLRLVFQIEQKAGDKVPKLTDGHADFHISKMDIEFDKKSLTHDVLVPLMTGMWNLQIQAQVEKGVEDNLKGLIDNIAGKLTSALETVNRPFLEGINQVREVVGQKAFATAYQNRMEKLE